ncbi:MAG: hypothetical protein A2Y93_09280 [Chloroflexi bacterium RBG_13_68_17]|nr:MAG: hypothetical protein A2Y93_09280 [Chloroflexi bacterium RBG_13_68_17]
MNRLRELTEEFRSVVAGRAGVVDTVLPPAAFLLVNAVLGFQAAMAAAVITAGVVAVLRWRRGQTLLYAVGGLAGALLAYLVADLSGRAEGFFLPGMFGGMLTLLACLVSLLARRPLVAWTSQIARRWPLPWYWHPRVRPAYAEVTFLWALFFALRLGIQWMLFQERRLEALATWNAVTGWPATVALLAASYLYGLWRLRRLEGPSVEELRVGTPPPWSGQRRGF